MARAAFVETLIASLPPDIRRALRAVFDYVLVNLRLGRAVTTQRAENLQLYFYEGTTPAVANTAFSFTHSLGKAPFLLVPVLPLDVAGYQIVPLAVPQVADEHRVYLSSSATDAPFMVLIEG